jgi:hypothetical protein
MNQLLIVAVSALAGGIGIAAAILTYRGCSPPAPTASDAQRQDALERFKIWNNFWKYFLVSFALVLNTKNQKLQHAIVADVGPRNRIGEGSIALAKAIGVPLGSGTHTVSEGGTDGGIIYKIYPGSGTGWPKTLDEINSEGEQLLKAWGGQQRLLSELAGRSDVSQPK